MTRVENLVKEGVLTYAFIAIVRFLAGFLVSLSFLSRFLSLSLSSSPVRSELVGDIKGEIFCSFLMFLVVPQMVCWSLALWTNLEKSFVLVLFHFVLQTNHGFKVVRFLGFDFVFYFISFFEIFCFLKLMSWDYGVWRGWIWLGDWNISSLYLVMKRSFEFSIFFLFF